MSLSDLQCNGIDVRTEGPGPHLFGAADYRSWIEDEIRGKGRPIPENDLWIAVLARQHGLMLAARDGHFREIDGLPLAEW